MAARPEVFWYLMDMISQANNHCNERAVTPEEQTSHRFGFCGEEIKIQNVRREI
jgi:hypothetical protein